MIEEIKKEIDDKVNSINMMPDNLGENYYISKDETFEILDKYNNQQTLVTLKDFKNVSNNLIKYKGAFNWLKSIAYVDELYMFEEAEQKYKLGGE